MNELIRGNMIMKNVADKDVNNYIKCGWKKIEKKPKIKPKQHKEVVQVNEDNNNSNIIEE